jgi:hypothetical protein
MKLRNFDPIFFSSSEGNNELIRLFEPHRKDIEGAFGEKLETLVSDKKLWEHLCTHPHELPPEVYKILSTIQEFGREYFRDDIVSLLKGSAPDEKVDKSCQYLVARLLLVAPDEVKILEARKLEKNRRRFFRFSLDSEYPKEYGINDMEWVMKAAAIAIAEQRTALGESVKVLAKNLEKDYCWQFAVKWCDKIQPTDIYNRKEKQSSSMILPVLGDVLIRMYANGKDVEINIDSLARARALIKAVEKIIWNDKENHFKKAAVYDLNPLRDVGAEVLKVTNDAVSEIILNMVEFHNVGEHFPTKFGENSETSNVMCCIDRLKYCERVDSAYFTVILKNGEMIKFGIKSPDHLDLAAVHRPFIADIVEEMGLEINRKSLPSPSDGDGISEKFSVSMSVVQNFDMGAKFPQHAHNTKKRCKKIPWVKANN